MSTRRSARRNRKSGGRLSPGGVRGDEYYWVKKQIAIVSAALISSTMAGSYARTVPKSAIGVHTTSARNSHGLVLVAAHSASSCTPPTVTTYTANSSQGYWDTRMSPQLILAKDLFAADDRGNDIQRPTVPFGQLEQ